MNILDAFELRTIDVQVTDKITEKVSAFCYGDLGAYRIDNFVRRHNGEGHFLAKQELWGVVLLCNGCILPPCPVFKAIENVTNFIYGLNLLCNSWARAGEEVYDRHKEATTALMRQQDGFPLILLLQGDPDFDKLTEEVGLRMNLNGYQPDAP